MNANLNKKNLISVITNLFFAFTLCIFVICAAAKFTLNFRQVYYFDIDNLNIEQESKFDKDTIIENYNYVIDYMNSPIEDEFLLPSIPYSQASQIHFHDVKVLFNYINILLLVTLIINIIGIYLIIKKKNYTILKWSSSMLLILPIILCIAFITNAESAFIMFHKMFFNNNYWILSPKTDPIIDIMPQEFFYHSAILIGSIIILFFIIFRIIYKKLNKKPN
jgi:integral membrane protein (TIGR01906 family)